MSRRHGYGWWIVGLILLIYEIASDMAVRDAVQEQATYCRMVRLHRWPDYKHYYRDECLQEVRSGRR